MSEGKVLPTNFFSTAAPPAAAPLFVPTGVFASNVTHRETAKGTHILENLRIFKVGTFKDMFGFEHTWDDLHLDQMVMHYALLKNGGYFPDVPIRADHSFSVQNVVGYFEDLYRDKDDPSFLSGTVEFTEPEAWQKWERRTWRGRSVEVGMYETNDGKSFWPVVMGLAFVDIPAVEGLHARQRGVHFSQVILDNEEQPVATEPAPTASDTPSTPPTPPSEPSNPQPAPAPAPSPSPAPSPTPSGVVTPPALAPVPVPAPFAAPQPSGQPLVFRLNGHQTSDFSMVQRHIDALEVFRNEQTTAGRKEFVEGLAHGNKIAASQIESLTAHALSLTDEQFATFRATYEAAPAVSLFGQQGQQPGSEPPNPGNTSTTDPEDPDLLTEIVQQHRRSGMKLESIQKTNSYKKLVALGKAPF